MIHITKDEANTTMTLCMAAGWYAAELNIPVFPCVPGKKVPATARGFKDATTDTDELHDQWEARPDCNIGVSTERLVVLDVERDGLVEFGKLCRDRGWDFSRVPCATTPNGGVHLYFDAAEFDIKCRVKVDGLAVDVRAKGGYVVGPPSTIPGVGVYAFKEGRSLLEPEIVPPPLPGRVRAMDMPRRAPESPKSQPLAGLVKSPLERHLGVSEGSRNRELCRLVFSHLNAKPGDVDGAVKAAIEWGGRCNPPLGWEECQAKAFYQASAFYKKQAEQAPSVSIVVTGAVKAAIAYEEVHPDG